jgi:hypothetical protein
MIAIIVFGTIRDNMRMQFKARWYFTLLNPARRDCTILGVVRLCFSAIINDKKDGKFSLITNLVGAPIWAHSLANRDTHTVCASFGSWCNRILKGAITSLAFTDFNVERNC